MNHSMGDDFYADIKIWSSKGYPTSVCVSDPTGTKIHTGVRMKVPQLVFMYQGSEGQNMGSYRRRLRLSD